MINPFDDSDALNQYCEEVVFRYLNNPTRTSFGYRASCPVCHEGSSGSKKKRFQYYRETHSAYCFNAGCPVSEKGLSGLSLTSLLRGFPQATENVEYIKWYNNNISDAKRSFVKTANDMESFNPNKNSKPLPEYTPELNHDENLFEDSWVDLPGVVKEYCDNRKMFSAPFAPHEWKLYYDIITKRLVIPWMKNDNIVYYQKRALFKGDDPKYLYPSNSHRPIFNFDMIDKNFPYIFITEGAIDCCFLKNGIACGGLTPSVDQKEELVESFPDFKLVILTDNQWIDSSAKIALMGNYREKRHGLIESGMSDFSFFIWPKIQGCYFKDINECICSNSRDHHFDDPEWLSSHTYNALQAKFMMLS